MMSDYSLILIAFIFGIGAGIVATAAWPAWLVMRAKLLSEQSIKLHRKMLASAHQADAALAAAIQQADENDAREAALRELAERLMHVQQLQSDHADPNG